MRFTSGLLITLFVTGTGAAQDSTPYTGWIGVRNRLLPSPLPVIWQDFGHAHGRIGGRVTRSPIPAYYAMRTDEKTLSQPLLARGRLRVTQADGGSGAIIGWFDSGTTKGWRAPNTIAMRIDGNGGKFWVFFEYGTAKGRTGGAGCFEGEAYQTTRTKPFPADGRWHDWELRYDPEQGGRITLTLDQHIYRLPLAEGHQADGARFDRFGIYNQQITGKGIELEFAQLTVDGQSINLERDPGWEGQGNRVEVPSRFIRPRHDFGYSNTQHCGPSATGEIGGVIWRDVQLASFAASVKGLSLETPMKASGVISLQRASSDSGCSIGWFRAVPERGDNGMPADRLAILIEGPSRVGHYFRPEVLTSDGKRSLQPSGPVIVPDGKPVEWMLAYDPKPGHGVLTYRLGQDERTIPLTEAQRRAGARLNRFGLFVHEKADGHFVELYLASLQWTGQ